MKTIKQQLLKQLNIKHGRPVEILFVKNLGLEGFAVKFQFIDDGYIKSEVVRI